MAPIVPSMLRQALSLLPKGGQLTKITKSGVRINYYKCNSNTVLRHVITEKAGSSINYQTRFPEGTLKFPIRKGMNDLRKSQYELEIFGKNGYLSRDASNGKFYMEAPESMGEDLTMLTSDGNGLLVGRKGVFGKPLEFFTKPQSDKLLEGFLSNESTYYNDLGKMIYNF